MLDTVVRDLGREAVRTLRNCGVSFYVINTIKFAVERSVETLRSPLDSIV